MRTWTAVGLAGLLLASASACGNPSQPPGSTKLTMTDFKFDPASVDHKAGTMTFYLVNNGATGHDLVIQDSSGKQIAKSSLVDPGKAVILDVSGLSAGTYDFFCDILDHKDLGMVGKLNVT